MQSYTDLVRHKGNEPLFGAVEMSILSSRMGWPLHLHAEGVRGTGKTTILRAAQSMLPRIRRIRQCLYNCDPAQPHCPHHRHLSANEIRRLGTEWIAMPFLEISHSAKLGTVVGTIDLTRITAAADPAAVLLPGTLAQAHRGVVLVDEINRLADTAPELADVLLDVMGTRPGRLQIEESGLPPVALPLRVSVWAASNPDEEPGPLEDIRRQLADRFDLTVDVGRPSSAADVRRILDAAAGSRETMEINVAPGSAATAGPRSPSWTGARARRIALLRRLKRPVPEMQPPERDLMAELYIRFDFESLRAVETWQWAARMAAHRAGRPHVERSDLMAVAALVLSHRLDARSLSQLLTELDEHRSSTRQMAGAATDATLEKVHDTAGAERRGRATGDGRSGGEDQLWEPRPDESDTAGNGRGAGTCSAGAGHPDADRDAGLMGRLRHLRNWLQGDDHHNPGCSDSSSGGRRPLGGPGGRLPSFEDDVDTRPVSAPPHRAAALASLSADEIYRRLLMDDTALRSSRPSSAEEIDRHNGITDGRDENGARR